MTETRKTRANNNCLDLVLQLYRNQLNILEQVQSPVCAEESNLPIIALQGDTQGNRRRPENIETDEPGF